MRDDELLEWERSIYELRKQKRRKKSLLCKLIELACVLWIIVLLVYAVGIDAKETIKPPVETPVETFVETIEEADPLEDFSKIEDTTITAYCICEKCCGKDETHPAYGITASGRTAEPFVSVAVDPKVIPLGSVIMIDFDGEMKEYRADDTGSGVKGAHIDVCYPSHQTALEHGVKTATVYYK